ncbi:MAG: hypothetical protein O9295_22875 [Microcystis sp. LE18-22.4A]|nr:MULTISPECIES: hypothetical protein [Microcystis]MCZ8120808.1 hypothetical protein [Microcystis sp. LE18-22.4A]
MGKTLHPTPHTPHPTPTKNFLPQTLNKGVLLEANTPKIWK